MSYICEKCGIKPALKNIRYCKKCKMEVVGEMMEVGYLQQTGFCYHHAGEKRTDEMKENVYQTIHGTGH